VFVVRSHEADDTVACCVDVHSAVIAVGCASQSVTFIQTRGILPGLSPPYSLVYWVSW